jgi:hypothetical protein
MAFLDDLKRMLGQQSRYPMDEKLPNGAAPADLIQAATAQPQTPYSQNINPTVRPQPQPAAQGNWRDLVKQGVTPNTVLNRYAKPNVDETTQLNPQDEAKFQQWVKDKKVPWQDSPFADYDMRGYYQAQQSGDPNAKQNLSGFDQTMHFPDTYKTKYHKTFSNESKYALPNAPSWQGDRLVDEKGNVVADETPQAQPSAVMNGVKRAVTPTPQPTLDQALMSGGPTQAEQPAAQPQPSAMGQPQRNPYRDQLTQDEAQLRALEDKKDKFWKRAVIAGINAGQAGFGYQPTQIQTSRTRDIAKTQGRIARDMKVLQDTGQLDAREAAILHGQAQIQQGQDRINQGDARIKAQAQRAEDADLLRYYNGRTDFDPTDPAEADFVARWQKRFGYTPNKNVRGSQLATVSGYDTEGNPTVKIINKGKNTSADVAGPLPATTEGQANRTAANTRSANQIAAGNQRSAAGIASREKIATMPQRPRSASQRALPPAIQQNLAKGAGEYDQYKDELTGIDSEIQKANALPANWSGPDPDDPKKTVTKNEVLAGLGSQRASKVARIKKRMAELNQLDPENEWGSGTGGYPYRKPKAGATSDLNQPIQGTPTADPKVQKYADKYFNGNYQKAMSEIKRQRGQ